jgi:hypothetical protein
MWQRYIQGKPPQTFSVKNASWWYSKEKHNKQNHYSLFIILYS